MKTKTSSWVSSRTAAFGLDPSATPQDDINDLNSKKRDKKMNFNLNVFQMMQELMGLSSDWMGDQRERIERSLWIMSAAIVINVVLATLSFFTGTSFFAGLGLFILTLAFGWWALLRFLNPLLFATVVPQTRPLVKKYLALVTSIMLASIIIFDANYLLALHLDGRPNFTAALLAFVAVIIIGLIVVLRTLKGEGDGNGEAASQAESTVFSIAVIQFIAALLFIAAPKLVPAMLSGITGLIATAANVLVGLEQPDALLNIAIWARFIGSIALLFGSIAAAYALINFRTFTWTAANWTWKSTQFLVAELLILAALLFFKQGFAAFLAANLHIALLLGIAMGIAALFTGAGRKVGLLVAIVIVFASFNYVTSGEEPPAVTVGGVTIGNMPSPKTVILTANANILHTNVVVQKGQVAVAEPAGLVNIKVREKNGLAQFPNDGSHSGVVVIERLYGKVGELKMLIAVQEKK